MERIDVGKMKKLKAINYDKVIGIPLTKCFVCGKPGDRHHVIPKAFRPMLNVTIPLCEEHKDITHPIIKQFYFPKEIRRKLGKAKKHSEDVLSILNSVKKELQFHNKNNATKFHICDDETSKLKD